MPPKPTDALPRELTFFISGTNDDLEEYRLAVAGALERANHHALDSHRRPGNHSSILRRLKKQLLEQSHAYIGVFGFRYGTLVPDQDEVISYSEYEYNLANEVGWVDWPEPPIFVFLPSPRSDAERALRAFCDRALEALRPEEAAKDRERQSRFLKKVGANGLRTSRYGSKDELREAVVTDIGSWLTDFLIEQRERYRQLLTHTSGGYDVRMVGRAGHCSQARAAHAALLARRGSGNPPGMCLLAYGREGSGQASLASLLRSQDFWALEDEPRFRILEPGQESTDEAIWWLLWQAVGHQPGASAADAETLARAAAETCAARPVFLSLENIHHFKGGLEGFAERVWAPLYRNLTKVWQVKPPRHHVFVLVTTETGGGKPPEDVIWSGRVMAETVDYARILPLLELAPLTVADLDGWLRPIIPNDPERWSKAEEIVGDGRPEEVQMRLSELTSSIMRRAGTDVSRGVARP